jgi:hypothetical protein
MYPYFSLFGISEFIIIELYYKSSSEKLHIHPATIQSTQSIQNASTEDQR